MRVHTQVSSNTVRYKGRDLASDIGKKLPLTRFGATTVVAPLSEGSMTTKEQMNPGAKYEQIEELVFKL